MVRTGFNRRRALTITATSFATLTLIPWTVEATRTPRLGLVLGAVPLALLFGALAGYAASPTTPTLVSPSSRERDSAVVGAWLHVAAEVPQRRAPGTPAAAPAALTAAHLPPDPARPTEQARPFQRLGRSAHLQLVTTPSAATAASGADDRTRLRLLRQPAAAVRQAPPAAGHRSERGLVRGVVIALPVSHERASTVDAQVDAALEASLRGSVDIDEPR